MKKRCVVQRALGRVKTEERAFGEEAELMKLLDLRAGTPLPASSQALPRPSRGRVNCAVMACVDANAPSEEGTWNHPTWMTPGVFCGCRRMLGLSRIVSSEISQFDSCHVMPIPG